MNIDWMWVYENPKEAAELMDKMQDLLWEVFNKRGRFVDNRWCAEIERLLKPKGEHE